MEWVGRGPCVASIDGYVPAAASHGLFHPFDGADSIDGTCQWCLVHVQHVTSTPPHCGVEARKEECFFFFCVSKTERGEAS